MKASILFAACVCATLCSGLGVVVASPLSPLATSETAATLATTAESMLSDDAATMSTGDTELTAAIKTSPPEPFWGRIYLRHGVTPIQYFRDSFAGPMVSKEVEFYFPKAAANQFGCNALASDESDMIALAAAANQSIALVVDRGECTFEEKARYAEAAGVAVLVVVNTDESVSRPVALLSNDDGEDNKGINMPSVMVRQSAGRFLRATALSAGERVLGRLLPMVCTSHPYACEPRTASELAYMNATATRSGKLVAAADNVVVGEFLASMFGGVLPQRAALPVSPLLHASVVCQTSDTEPLPRLDGQIALIAGSDVEDDDCTVVDMVTHAQLAGAAAALVVMDSSTHHVTTRPSVREDWLGYNVTIFSAAISATTILQLVALQEQQQDVQFALDNALADAWEHIARLATRTEWPTRSDRKDELLARLFATYDLNATQRETLKRHYVDVAGGRVATWDALVAAHLQRLTISNESIRDEL